MRSNSIGEVVTVEITKGNIDWTGSGKDVETWMSRSSRLQSRMEIRRALRKVEDATTIRSDGSKLR